MALLSLSDTLGNIHKIDFPASLRELPYSRKMDFDVAMEDIALWAKSRLEEMDEGDQDWAEYDELADNDGYYLFLLCRAVSAFLGYDLHKVMHFDTSDLVDSHGNLLPYTGPGEDLWEKIDLESAEVTLRSLYEAAREVIDGYKFEFRTTENFQFTHAGKLWTIPHVVRNLFDGRKVFSKFSTQQAVETLMIRNYLDENVNNKKREDMDGETVANQRFSAHLNLIAIAVNEVRHINQDGEMVEYIPPMPSDQTDFDTMVADRVQLFADIDTQKAMDIVFFLTHITRSSVETRRTSSTSKRRKAKRQKR